MPSRPLAPNRAASGHSLEGPMGILRAMISVLRAVASGIMRTLTRVAKRLAAPGAGPKFVIG